MIEMITVAIKSVKKPKRFYKAMAILTLIAQLAGCNSDANVAGTRHIDIPEADAPGAKFSKTAVNRLKEAPVVYVKLGDDVLKPMRKNNATTLPSKKVGPFELREETLAAALQLVMADADIPLAFQTSEALARTVTVSQLSGPMGEVVDRLCSLADLYCSYDKGVLVIKDVETFSVSLPPLAADNYDDFLNGIRTVTGRDAYIDATTRTLIYSSSHRNSDQAEEYFERLRANTALIVFETQIWEVTLNNGNNTGIRWETLDTTSATSGAPAGSSSNSVSNGNLGFNGAIPGATIAGAISGGVRYLSGDLNANIVFQFLSTQGAVKTISQPQITVLSGSTAKLRVGNSQKYVSQITRTAGLSTSGDSLSLTTDTLNTGLNMEINSAWDQSTVYGNLKLDLQDLVNIDKVTVGGVNGTSIQLPETAERSLETRIRIRPGDALIIGGIVQERDQYRRDGLGGMKPIIPTNRADSARNSELVIMMRPHVVVYTDKPPADAVLLNDGLYLDNPQKEVPAVNIMSPASIVAAPPQMVAIPANAPAAVGAAVPVVQQSTRQITVTDAEVVTPGNSGGSATRPAPLRPKPLSPAEVQRFNQQVAKPPVSTTLPPAPSMSQYLNDLAPMQIAPSN